MKSIRKAQTGGTIKSTRVVGDTAAVNKKIRDLGLTSPSFKNQLSKSDSLLQERLKARKK